MKALRMAAHPCAGLAMNGAYALCSCLMGAAAHSWWLLTLGAYYAVLACARFCVLMAERKAKIEPARAMRVTRTTGVLLVLLSVCLAGINTLSAVKDRGTVFGEIIMIAIALYSFTKMTVAIIGMVKARRVASPIIRTLRNIALADAFVSIYTLQRSMLVSFPGLTTGEIRLFNILTGTAVWLIVLLLGINLIGGKRITMAKSKLVQANEKIAEAVTEGYKKIEKGVVEGYKKIEQGVVGGYEKIEDRFVDRYLTKDGESVEEAKERLKKENE